jgi:thioredoxin 1
MSQAKELTSNDFNEVINNEGYYFIDFWAPWCPPCRYMSPIFDGLAGDEELKHVNFRKVNTDEENELAQKFNVTGLPTFILIKSDGKGNYEEVQKFMGAQDGLTFKSKVIQAASA